MLHLQYICCSLSDTIMDDNNDIMKSTAINTYRVSFLCVWIFAGKLTPTQTVIPHSIQSNIHFSARCFRTALKSFISPLVRSTSCIAWILGFYGTRLLFLINSRLYSVILNGSCWFYRWFGMNIKCVASLVRFWTFRIRFLGVVYFICKFDVSNRNRETIC